MELRRNPIHDVKSIDIAKHGDELKIEICAGDEELSAVVDSVQLDDPEKVCIRCHRNSELRADYEAGMCRVHEIDGHQYVHCQGWEGR